MTTSLFDPFDAATSRDAWSQLQQLREEGPVVPIARDMRYVTRYAECREMLKDTVAFSNATGFKAPGVEIPPEDRLLGELDPPLHTAVRRVMVTALTPTIVREAEPFIVQTARELLGRIPVPGSVDLVSAFTVPLPNRVTVHLLGLPESDAEMIAGWAKELMESGFPATNRSSRGEGFAAAFPDFARYIDDTISRRQAEFRSGTDVPTRDHAREDRPHDVLTRLLELEVDGVRLRHRQVRALVRNLITGGLTTTSQLIGNLLYLLLTRPDLESVLRRDTGHTGDTADASTPAMIDHAIEESLRLTPPVLLIPRGCVADTEIAGQPIKPGDRVVAGTASANRDEQVFAAGDEFRLDRANAERHLTFGYGPHVCPGASLARSVARVALAQFLDHFPTRSVTLAPDFVYEHVPTFFECGPRRLPVEVEIIRL
jgi:cytochrome P450